MRKKREPAAEAQDDRRQRTRRPLATSLLADEQPLPYAQAAPTREMPPATRGACAAKAKTATGKAPQQTKRQRRCRSMRFSLVSDANDGGARHRSRALDERQHAAGEHHAGDWIRIDECPVEQRRSGENDGRPTEPRGTDVTRDDVTSSARRTSSREHRASRSRRLFPSSRRWRTLARSTRADLVRAPNTARR